MSPDVVVCLWLDAMTDYCMSSIMSDYCRYFQRIAFQESVSNSELNQQRSAGNGSPGGVYESESESESGRRMVERAYEDLGQHTQSPSHPKRPVGPSKVRGVPRQS